MAEKKVTTNLIWRLLERFGAQGVTLLVSIILARILDPNVYGTIALITVITTILQVFVDGGFSTALVQKKDSDDLDFSTVFFANFALCLVVYFVLFVFAPFISSFYSIPALTSVIRVLGLVVIVSGIKSIQQSYISKHLLFKKFFFATLGGTIISAIVGIWMAYEGYGVWALVLQYLLNTTVDTIILWLTVKWRPKFAFSWNRLRRLFSFGWKILISGLIDKFYTELRSLIIGKKYSTEDLAYYNKGQQFPQIIAININTAIDSTLLPVLSNAQDDKKRVKAMTRRAIKTSSFFLWPCMLGLAACSRPLVILLLTDKWLEAVPYLVIFCVTYGFYPISTANLNAIKAMGRSDLFLILEICKKVVGFIIILISMHFGVLWMAISYILSNLLGQIINAWPNRRLLDYPYRQQLCDLMPSLLLALFMGMCVFGISLLGLPNIITLLVQIPLGIFIYLYGAWLFKFDSFSYCLTILKALFKK